MGRYSLPHQLHVASALSFALTLWMIYLALRAPYTQDTETQQWVIGAASFVVLHLAGVLTAQALPRRLEVWVLDRRPFWGACVVSLIHIYVQMLTLQVFVTVLDVMDGRFLEGWWTLPLMPLLWQVYFAPITLVVLAVSTVGGGLMLRYLGGRRDYFSK
ncbi:MAG TPA: hypothetical protein PLZ57_08695 [Pseudobdellovibrionaceae bacterium]|nr:hypothetical protein [Pseudobdellovibrionaceae bacterium]